MPLTQVAQAQASSDEPAACWALWGCATALAAALTTLLYGAMPGINWPLCVSAVVAALVYFRGWRGKAQPTGVLVPLALACFIALCAALTADVGYDVLIAVVTMLALATAVISASPIVASTPSVLAAPYAAVLVTCEAGRRTSLAHQAVRAGRATAALRGVALAVPITLLLALLLSQADPTLGATRDWIVTAFQDLSVLPRGILFCVLAVCLVGAFGLAAQPAAALAGSSAEARTARQSLGDTERLIVTGAISSLFTLFLVLQVAYLFGDPGGRSGSGVSYADAVHRGFTELNMASSVCVVVLFALRRYSRPTQHPRLIRALEWIVVAQAQVLLVSAFFRVDLYEAAYGFTRLRLVVQVYAAVAAIALCLLAIELRAQPVLDRLLRRVLVVATVAFGTLVLSNADAWIADRNLVRYTRTGQLDIEYLINDLGPDAVPDVVGFIRALPAPIATRAANCLRTRYAGYAGHSQDRWFEWSLRRVALGRAMSALGPASASLPDGSCAGR